MQKDRREFLRSCSGFLGGLTIVGVAAPLFSACEPTNNPSGPPGNGGNNNGNGTQFDVRSLTADGQGLVTQSKGTDGYRILIVRISATDYRALSMQCTHEGCSVNAPASGEITCSCHGSKFELTGVVKQGPAASPLTSYPTTYDASSGRVTVTIT